ncbi:MAG: RNA polymerase recycling motor HelD [Terrisporobacter sp.]|uniref:RNA polymerase recycling motor HelD n=1 Tax=Terrisporobacter sp. TaxID=1965305 RepID=UPI002FCA571E
MSINNNEWNLEKEWLEKVLEETTKQLSGKREAKDRLQKEAKETQRELWEELGSINASDGLDQIAEFVSVMDTIKNQKRSHEFNAKQESKYEKMLKSPYFGRIDFKEEYELESEKCYIGLSNLTTDDFDFLVYDWRAPISSMFYDYETGSASYECPQGTISGEITTKRQYKINDRKIEYMFDSNLSIDDEMLQELLSKSADDKMKGIVTSIQKEQNQVIRNEDYKNLIVQGAAGSGKTSVALHRIAYLLYKHRDRITAENIIIFSPNNIFNDYISNVLPQLGEENMYQTTFKDYMHEVLGNRFKKETPSEMMEYILDSNESSAYDYRVNNINFKTSVEFVNILKEYVHYLETNKRHFEDIIIRDEVIISAKEIQHLFLKEFADRPFKKRLEKIKSRILFLIEPYEKAWRKEIYKELESSGYYLDRQEMKEESKLAVRKHLKDVYDKISRMTYFNSVSIYRNMFKYSNKALNKLSDKYGSDFINNIKTYTIENLNENNLYYEDQVALLYFKIALGEILPSSQIKYVIIDEAQDYTPLQYEIFYRLFKSAKMTMLGDINQSINPFMNVGDYNNIYNISKEDTCIINLTKTYRSTAEITKFARKLLVNNLSDEYVARHGDEPTLINFNHKDKMNKQLIEEIRNVKEKNYKSIGVITKTARETNELYSLLQSNNIEISSITKDDDSFTDGIVVIPSYLAKGLEFDVVFIYDASNKSYNNEDERLLLYTCCTRALHVLNIYYVGEITDLLK